DALLYWNARDWSDAAWAYETAVKRNPADAEAWYRLGSARDRMRECTRAVPALRQALARGTDHRCYSLFLIARCQARDGNVAASMSTLDEALRSGYVDEDNELITDADFDAVRADRRFSKIAIKVAPPR